MKSIMFRDEYKNQFVNSLTARERLDVLKSYNTDLEEIDNKYIDKWMNRKSIVNQDSFFIKLENERFTEDDFNYAIKDLTQEERKKIFVHLDKMEWYDEFKRIIKFFDDFNKEENKEYIQYDMTYPVSPFIYWASSKIQQLNQKLTHIDISDFAFGEILQALLSTLINIVQKSITMELHRTKKNKSLVGNTPEERFQYFIKENFASLDSLVRFYSKYAAITRVLTVKTSYFVENITQAFIRLDDNAEIIKERLDIDIYNKSIKKIKCNEGDSHQKGKAVIQFIFEDDNIIVYKPRNLEITKKYHEFIKWFNKKSGLVSLPINEGVYKDDFTFEKFIDYKSCNTEEEVKNYYLRFGEIIAIMHILCANDFHLENIIANGSYPNIIDLETLLQQVIPIDFADRADIIAKKNIVDSVINTGLLPFIAFADNMEGKGIDISGLNGGDQKLPFKVLLPTNLYTDEMVYEYQDYVRIGANNLPMLKNEKIKFTKYSKFIIDGFRNTCNFVIKNKELFIGNKGILNMFKGILVRQIMKSTQRYAVMLDFSYHPNCTESFLEREKLFENLWGYPYENKEVIKYEIDDMYFDDIPIFFTYPDSKDLITSKGEIIKDYFQETSLNRAKDRIANLDVDEVEKQVSYMIISFGEYENVSGQILKNNNKKFLKNTGNITLKNEMNFLDESCKIADEILKQVIYSKDKQTLTWSDIIYNESGVWEPGDVNEGLYGGLAGISLYFYLLYNLTNQTVYKETAEKTVELAITKSRYISELNSFTGRGSLLFTLLVLYKDTKNVKYIKEIDEIIKYIEENSEHINKVNWLQGSAGLIQNLLNAYDILKKDSYLIVAEKIGMNMIDKLLEKSDTTLLGGMGHGASGICFSLFKLGCYTKNSSFTDKGIELLNYDRSLFDKERQGWIDKQNNRNEIEKKWCHGSTGIGLSRLMILNFYKDDQMLSEIDLAVESVCNEMKEDDCLCHGNFGDIEFLLCYYQLTKKKDILEIINRKLENIFSYHKLIKNFRIRTIPKFIPVGIFTGLSGIGYELLRVYDPEKVPSILKLDIN